MANKLKWGTALHTAKRVAPPLESMYQGFSEQFTHIERSQPHRGVNVYLKHESRDDVTSLNFATIRLTTAALAIVSEAVLFHWVPKPQFFRSEGKQIFFDPKPEAKERIKRLVREPDPPLGAETGYSATSVWRALRAQEEKKRRA